MLIASKRIRSSNKDGFYKLTGLILPLNLRLFNEIQSPSRKVLIISGLPRVKSAGCLDPGRFFVGAKDRFHHLDDLAQRGIGADRFKDIRHGIFTTLAGEA